MNICKSVAMHAAVAMDTAVAMLQWWTHNLTDICFDLPYLAKLVLSNLLSFYYNYYREILLKIS